MKVSEILKNFDFLGKIKILENCTNSRREEVCFEGTSSNCPWIYAEMDVDTSEDGEGMFVGIGVGDIEPYLGIYVKEDKD